MALSVHQIKVGKSIDSLKFLNLTMLGGLLFLVLKSIEYYLKIEAGLHLDIILFLIFIGC